MPAKGYAAGFSRGSEDVGSSTSKNYRIGREFHCQAPLIRRKRFLGMYRPPWSKSRWLFCVRREEHNASEPYDGRGLRRRPARIAHARVPRGHGGHPRLRAERLHAAGSLVGRRSRGRAGRSPRRSSSRRPIPPSPRSTSRATSRSPRRPPFPRASRFPPR